MTGATGGIGEAIARRLAAEGLAVTLVGRSDERLRAARERIEAAVPGADLTLERADLADLAQVRDLGERLLAGPGLDVVVSNAALITPLDLMTSDGLPRVLAVNHLAPYLLLRTLAPGLTRARLVVVGADPVSGDRRPIDLDDLTFTLPDRLGYAAALRPFLAYGQTKTMNAMFVFALARRLAGSSVTVNCAHPGVIRGTGLSREVPGLTAAVSEAVRDGVLPMPGPQPRGWGAPSFSGSAEGPDPDVGADTPAWLATSPEVEGVSGRFFVDRAPVERARHATDATRCERLWVESARLTGLPA
ncbi:MAG TPA: SDR family NAD(P)-dependent oxidoreductase [Candidatus Dormibacteraeota bacterium]|nr:SDR family NAD(P)-dependent oxidoreductase [Candidatus Dormibacteraeota bacterium]